MKLSKGFSSRSKPKRLAHKRFVHRRNIKELELERYEASFYQSDVLTPERRLCWGIIWRAIYDLDNVRKMYANVDDRNSYAVRHIILWLDDVSEEEFTFRWWLINACGSYAEFRRYLKYVNKYLFEHFNFENKRQYVD